MPFKPMYLTDEEIDSTFENCLKNMERMHLTALAHQHMLSAFPPGHWDTDRGNEVMDKVREEWLSCKGD